MKNKYIIIAFVAILFGGITSCNEFLDEEARGSLTPDTFFKNSEEVTLALNALNDDVGSAGFLQHLGTDIGNSGRTPLSAAGKFGGYEYFPDTGRVNNTWGGYYTVIRDTNVFLASIEKSSLSDEIKGNAIAQILFYRAFAYLKLVVEFGDVPYWTDGEVGIEEVSLLGKTESKVILNGMVVDLERAISLNMSTSRWNENEGRPTVWAARMLKAYCHVWLAKDDAQHWASAKAELIEITTNSPHQLNDDYADMYRGGNEFHDEIIFGKLYKADVKGSNIVSSRYRRQSENRNAIAAMNESGLTSGASQINLRRSFANSYDNNDKRKLYNVWDSQLLEDGTTTATFNWVYITKFQRGPVPTNDPLLSFVEATKQSTEPARIFLISDAYLLLAEAEFMINGGSSQVAL
ncbi:RagB/SusD family nutrient uptake outer membrane protein, partial [Polaribacter sp.]|nr:RagB/SusD family nutrient uptake outer membrane protein [Polaribacter sp.]